uniref:Uncharacterized protein n=1 Tax=Anguilla anguilla TaxID=7936 RepID=A0A0E9W7F2_ANGAN
MCSSLVLIDLEGSGGVVLPIPPPQVFVNTEQVLVPSDGCSLRGGLGEWGGGVVVHLDVFTSLTGCTRSMTPEKNVKASATPALQHWRIVERV